MVMQWPFVWMSGSAEPGHINMCLVARIARKDRCFSALLALPTTHVSQAARKRISFSLLGSQAGAGRLHAMGQARTEKQPTKHSLLASHGPG